MSYEIYTKLAFDSSAIEDAHRKTVELLKMGFISNRDVEYMLDEFTYGVESFFIEGGRDDYLTAAKFAVLEGFRHFVDIGCANGFQGEIFLQTPVRYLGIESNPTLLWKHASGLSYVKECFPCALPPLDGRVLGASRLCVGYLMPDYEAIAEVFDDFLLYGPAEAVEALSTLYATTEKIVDAENPDTLGWTWFHRLKRRKN